MNELKCDLIVLKVQKTEALEKEDMHTVTMVGAMRLIPDQDNPRSESMYSEIAAIKITIGEVGQRDLLRMCGLGNKGDTKEMILQVHPQTTLESFGED